MKSNDVLQASGSELSPAPSAFASIWQLIGNLWFRALRAILACGCLGLIAALFVGWMAPWSYYCDLFANFRSQYILVGLGLIVIAAGLKRCKSLVVVVLLTLPHTIQVVPYYWPLRWITSRMESLPAASSEARAKEPSAVPGRPLRLVAFNVLYLNRDHERAIRFLRESHADLIVLCECNYGWFEAVRAGLADSHPYNSSEFFPMWDGTRVFSRQPLRAATDFEHFRQIPEAEKLLAVSTRWQDREITVMGIHTASPTSAQRFKIRNEMLALMEQVGTQVQDPLIMAGDFNCTSGSPFFVNDGRLRDSRVGFGWHGSWPTFAPELLRIPIDHVLVNQHWEVLHREVAPDVGSDHAPVIVDLRLLPDSASTTNAP
ncbi:MAG: endonuclease/exonuclease/phosphatase family protein [Planctomycetaceae bacterium]|nr:endonuclease/exonuclease/phosphatase family protein [Planctomycetaceae bacterium]